MVSGVVDSPMAKRGCRPRSIEGHAPAPLPERERAQGARESGADDRDVDVERGGHEGRAAGRGGGHRRRRHGRRRCCEVHRVQPSRGAARRQASQSAKRRRSQRSANSAAAMAARAPVPARSFVRGHAAAGGGTDLGRARRARRFRFASGSAKRPSRRQAKATSIERSSHSSCSLSRNERRRDEKEHSQRHAQRCEPIGGAHEVVDVHPLVETFERLGMGRLEAHRDFEGGCRGRRDDVSASSNRLRRGPDERRVRLDDHVRQPASASAMAS